jgi:hypothetical protein
LAGANTRAPSTVEDSIGAAKPWKTWDIDDDWTTDGTTRTIIVVENEVLKFTTLSLDKNGSETHKNPRFEIPMKTINPAKIYLSKPFPNRKGRQTWKIEAAGKGTSIQPDGRAGDCLGFDFRFNNEADARSTTTELKALISRVRPGDASIGSVPAR